MTNRYVVRRDATGYTVADASTREALVLSAAPKTGLSQGDAQHLADLFNKRVDAGAGAATR